MKWLQKCSPKDITSLPHLKAGESVDDYEWDCEEAKHLIGFIISGGATQPKKSATRWKAEIRPNTQNYKKKPILSSLYKIKHWKIECKSYEEIENQEATWFIDPLRRGWDILQTQPKNIDFNHLSDWCREREGEVIVCEKQGASWLPFEPLTEVKGLKTQNFQEAIWLKNTSLPKQVDLFGV